MDSLGMRFLTPVPCISLLPFVIRYLHAVFCLESCIFGWLVGLVDNAKLGRKQREAPVLAFVDLK